MTQRKMILTPLATFAAVAALTIAGTPQASAQGSGGYQGGGAQTQTETQTQGQTGQRGQARQQRQQGQRGQPQMQRRQQQQVDVSDEKLQKFVDVQSKLKKMQQNSQQGDASREQVRKKMVETIKNNGLDLQEYNKINQAVRSNPELRKKYQKMAQ